jgi:hypothetical protein
MPMPPIPTTPRRDSDRLQFIATVAPVQFHDRKTPRYQLRYPHRFSGLPVGFLVLPLMWREKYGLPWLIPAQMLGKDALTIGDRLPVRV